MSTKTNPFIVAIRWAARLSSTLFIGIFILMFLGEGFEPAKIKPIEWVMLLFGPFGLMLGMVIGWWKEGLGGVIIILSFLAALLTGGYSASGAGYMLICASPGFLFLLSWFLSKMAETPAHREDIALQSVSPLSGTELLEERQRIAGGLCPRCGAQVKPTDRNCPSCRVNLAFARGNLDQL